MVSSEDSAWDVPPSIFGTRAGGPTVQRLVLGGQLHRLRESRGISAEQAAEQIRGSHSKISRMEHGRVGFKERDVSDLLTLYGVTDSEERAALLNLAREANTPGWWHAYSDAMPTWLEPYVGLEAAASVLRTYEVQFVPGLLQTEEYARALIRLGSAVSDDETKGLPRRVRQASIAPQLRDNPPRRRTSAAPAPAPASGPTPAEIRQTMSALQRGWQEGRSQRMTASAPGDSPFEPPGQGPSADGDELRGESDGT